MGFSNIVVPYDKSEPAKRALKFAFDFVGSNPDAKITLLYVSDIPGFDDASFEAAARMAGVTAVDEAAAREAQRKYLSTQLDVIKADASDAIEGRGDIVSFKIISGKPQECIVEYANDSDADLIVMGNRGLGALRGVLGSVSYAVLRSVDTPVLIVK